MIQNAFFFSLHALGMMAVCTFGYGMIERKITMTSRTRQVLLGAVMGTGAALLMLQPVTLAGGLHIDGRGVFIGIAAAFGGPVAAAVAAAIAALTRIAVGGSGANLATTVTLMTAILACLWAEFCGDPKQRSLIDWCALAALMVLPSFAFTAGPVPHAAQVIPAVLGLTLAHVLIFGRLMEAEQRRGQKESELATAANTDVLTRLPNRRSFMHETLAVEQKKQTSKGLLLVDIDHFKRVNDTYGHDAGDEVLRVVGQQLVKVMRKTDVVARFGGEEFALLVDAVDEIDLVNIAERVRQALEVVVGYQKAAISLSVSIGGTFCGDRPFRFDQAYIDADRSLYQAKERGRARSVITRLVA